LLPLPASTSRNLPWSKIIDQVQHAAEQITRDRHLGHLEHTKGIIEVSKGEQTSIGRHSQTMKFQLQAGVESDPESDMICFTRYTVHLQPR
jgi:hypothetical protein